MPPSPKRAITVSIDDFSAADQRLLRSAFHAFVPFVLLGGLDEGNPRVISLGQPDGLVPPKDYPPGARVYAIVRIKGVDKPLVEQGLVPARAARK